MYLVEVDLILAEIRDKYNEIIFPMEMAMYHKRYQYPKKDKIIPSSLEPAPINRPMIRPAARATKLMTSIFDS